MNVLDFPQRKKNHDPIVMVTCYDYTFARILQDSEIDLILVGDSAAMVMHGHDTTLPMEVEDMAAHVRAVKRGAPDKFVVADMPFLSCRKGLQAAMDAVGKLTRAGAEAVKVEGITGLEELVPQIVAAGIPVMGHLGLTPQSINQLGGFRVQGRSEADRDRLLAEAAACQRAGCFALVLECVPADLAAAITRKLQIPTIGIGAGGETDGQVLVLQDLLGLATDFKPRFVRRYLNGKDLVLDALHSFADDVKRRNFPDERERYAG